MKKIFLALALLIGLSPAAHAQVCSTYPFTLTNGTTADANQVMANFNAIRNCVNSQTTTYVGPGDVVANAKAWYGFRGYQQAYTGRAANICLPSDTACIDMRIANGNIVFTPIFGTPCSATVICTVKTLYDQTQGGNCGGSCDITQATIASRPTVQVSCIGTLPCMKFNFASLQQLLAAGTLTQAQSYTVSSVAERSSNFTSTQAIFGDNTSLSFIGFSNAANTLRMRCGTTPDVTATAIDGTFHAIQSICGGSSSSIYIDGTSTTGSAATGSFSGAPSVSYNAGAVGGYVQEVGIWGSAFNSTQLTAVNANQRAYWGF